jgi:glycosyltransferase involved in cell wall biosynthesis
MADGVPGLQIAVPVSAMLLEGRCKAQLPSQKECLYRCKKSDHHNALAVACGSGFPVVPTELSENRYPNGIDRTIFHPQSSSLREKYHLEDKKIVLGVANVWNARKGLPDLLTLADRLGSDYQVVLIGLNGKATAGYSFRMCLGFYARQIKQSWHSGTPPQMCL